MKDNSDLHREKITDSVLGLSALFAIGAIGVLALVALFYGLW